MMIQFYSKLLCVVVLIILSTSKVSSQSTPVNFTGWYGYEGYHPFKEGKPWGFFAEGYLKRNHVITDRMQEFIRLGINYSLPNGNRITGGFAYPSTPFLMMKLLNHIAGPTTAFGNNI